MASLQCHKNTEKGFNQGYYGGSSLGLNANWARKATKKENKYQGSQNGYAMAYSESECYSEIQYPAHGMSKPQTAYRMAETWDEYGQSYGSHKSQNGNATSKTQVHGHGNGFGGYSSNEIAQMQAYGSSNHTSPRTHEGHSYGYKGPTPRNQKNSCRMDHGFSNHTNYETAEAYNYGETNGFGKYKNNGMVQSQGHLRGKHSGQGNGFIKNQAYGPGKNMSYETETYEYSDYSNESHYHGGARGRGYRAGNNSCSDTECDDDYGMSKVWISKAI
ncbi:hypothetical protein REPUB_Repub08aG0169000 [Reevesia pubescens]